MNFAHSIPVASDLQDRDFLAAYPGMVQGFARPAVRVDIVPLAVLSGRLHTVLVRGRSRPGLGQWKLPGAFLDVGDAFDHRGETLEECARREMLERTGIASERVHLHQYGTYAEPERDPRMRVISIAHLALVPENILAPVYDGLDPSQTLVVDVEEAPTLCFDHNRLLEDGTRHLRERLEHSDLGFRLAPDPFTVSDLRAVYEAVHGQECNAGNFHRTFQRWADAGVVEELAEKRPTGTRPAKLYRLVAWPNPACPKG